MIPFIERVKAIYPDLLIQHAERNEIGQNNDVFIVNQQYVFRFPKYVQGIHKLKRESQLLDFIKDKVSLPIPEPVFQSFQEMEVGKAFMGYKLIEGIPFWNEELRSVHDQYTVDAIALQLVTFLTELHTLQVPETILSMQQTKSIHDSITRLYVRIEQKLYPYMRDDAQQAVEQSFMTFLHDSRNQEIKQTLIHGDFGAGNIIWNRETCRIAGIIDFGGSGIGDPAYDFAGILSSYGESFFEKCVQLYPNGSQIAERVHFYRSTFALQEALHGLEYQDPEAFENGIKDYRK